MKHVILIPILYALACHVLAGESALTKTYQPLDGLGAGSIVISEVTCHDWYSHSGQPTSISLISAANVPPTNNPKEATENLNLASACGVRFSCGDMDLTSELALDATAFAIPERFDHPREEIVRASLECLRRCLPDKLRQTLVTLKSSNENKAWLADIVRQFNMHDRSKVFFTPAQ